MRIRNFAGHTFVAGVLGPDSTVVDFGMNQGAFTSYIVRTTGASVYGAEPVPALFEALPRTERVKPFNVAVGGCDGTTTLRLYHGHCASTLGDMVKSERPAVQIDVPLMSFARFRTAAGIGRIHLLKVDIEGAELDLFESMSDAEFAEIEQITVEFHDFLDSGHVPRIAAILDRLRRLGFYTINISLRHHADVLCINTKAMPLSALGRARLQMSKVMQGAIRVPRRHLLGLPN